MTEQKRGRDARFRLTDGLLIALMILPLVGCIVLKVLFTPESEGVDISGAMVFLRLPAPGQELIISESQVNSWAIMLTLLGLCLYLTHGLTEKAETKRQLIAEWIVEKCEGLVQVNMGERFAGYSYLIAAIMGLSALSSLSCLIGLFAPTGDVNVTAGWAILVFCLVTWTKLQGGILNYLKGFTEPIPVFTPMNFISEFSLRECDERGGHLGPDLHGAERTQPAAAGRASRDRGDSAAGHRPAGDSEHLFRRFQRSDAGVHFRDADNAERFRLLPAGGLGKETA